MRKDCEVSTLKSFLIASLCIISMESRTLVTLEYMHSYTTVILHLHFFPECTSQIAVA